MWAGQVYPSLFCLMNSSQSILTVLPLNAAVSWLAAAWLVMIVCPSSGLSASNAFMKSSMNVPDGLWILPSLSAVILRRLAKKRSPRVVSKTTWMLFVTFLGSWLSWKTVSTTLAELIVNACPGVNMLILALNSWFALSVEAVLTVNMVYEWSLRLT